MPEVNEPLPDSHPLTAIQAELLAAIKEQNETLCAIAAKLNHIGNQPVKPHQPTQTVNEAEGGLIFALYMFCDFTKTDIKKHQAKYGNPSGDTKKLPKFQKAACIEDLENNAISQGKSLNDFYSFGDYSG